MILYGSKALFEPVGLFTAKCHLYLQHPHDCCRNVPYRNPQCLTWDDQSHTQIPWTFDLNNTTTEDESIPGVSINPIDLFADAEAQDALEITDTPRILSTELYRHQKQALTFMMQRERGWAMDGNHRDIWKAEQDLLGKRSYQNIITGLRQSTSPRAFMGGLLIDAPGLGKSLSILALIASSIESQKHSVTDKASVFSTLVIVPKTCK